MANRKAWLQQRGSSWYVCWNDLNGQMKKKSLGKRKTDAIKFANKKTAELEAGTASANPDSWDSFIKAYREEVLSRLRPSSQRSYEFAIEHFARIIKPKKADALISRNFDRYVAKRISEKGMRDRPVSPATVNRELRSLRRVANIAFKWKQLPEKPQVDLLDESEDEPTFISLNEFDALYQACDTANRPTTEGIDPADWWRGLFMFASATGWRIGEILSLCWDDVDLDQGTARTRAGDNKGKRTVTTSLADVVVEHLALLPKLRMEVFPWDHASRELYKQFQALQVEAGIKKTCTKDHKHIEACNFYGFHDFRRMFASLNASTLSASQLQSQMRHRSYSTTQRYIAMSAQKREDVVSKLVLPEPRRAK